MCVYIYIYIYVWIYVCICICICIIIYIYMYIYIYIHIYIYMITKFQIEPWDHSSNVKVFWASNHLSGHAQTFPPGYRNLQEHSHLLLGSGAQREHLKKQTCSDSQPMFSNFPIFEKQLPEPMCKTARAIECTIQKLHCIRSLHSISLVFYTWGTKYISIIVRIIIIYIYININSNIDINT